MQLKIISAESDNVTDRKLKILVCRGFRKEKHIFLQLAFVYVLVAAWKQHTRSGL